jgi:hypothetical protein
MTDQPTLSAAAEIEREGNDYDRERMEGEPMRRVAAATPRKADC